MARDTGLTPRATLADLSIPHRVVVNDEAYVSERRLILCLAAVYAVDNKNKLVIARLCDDYLDASGRLLGLVRDQATGIVT